MKSYADEGFLAESAQPFFSNLRMVPPETPAGANLFLGELEFERNVVQKPSIAPEMHNTSRQLHKRRESVNEKKHPRVKRGVFNDRAKPMLFASRVQRVI